MFHLSDLHQFVLAGAQAQLLAVLQTGLPAGVGMDHLEEVGAGSLQTGIPGDLVQDGALVDLLGVDGVHAGLVQGDGVKGGEHAHIGDDGQIVAVLAVAVGGNVGHDVDVEGGTAVHYCLGVFSDLAVQHGAGFIPAGYHGVHGTGGDASAATHADVVVDVGLAFFKGDGAVGAVFGADAAAHALCGLDGGLAGGVHLHLAGPGAAAHADVLQTAAEAGGAVALEVAQRDKHVGVHKGAADLGLLDVLAAFHGDIGLVGALETVGDDHMAAGGEGGEAVFVGGIQMLQSVFAAANIQGVGVGQEGLAAQFLDEIGQSLGVLGTEIGHVARLAHVQFDAGKLFVEINILDTRRNQQAAEFLGNILFSAGKIGKIDLRCHLFLTPFRDNSCGSDGSRIPHFQRTNKPWSMLQGLRNLRFLKIRHMIQQDGKDLLAHGGGAGVLVVLPQGVLVEMHHDESTFVIGAKELLEPFQAVLSAEKLPVVVVVHVDLHGRHDLDLVVHGLKAHTQQQHRPAAVLFLQHQLIPQVGELVDVQQLLAELPVDGVGHVPVEGGAQLHAHRLIGARRDGADGAEALGHLTRAVVQQQEGLLGGLAVVIGDRYIVEEGGVVDADAGEAVVQIPQLLLLCPLGQVTEAAQLFGQLFALDLVNVGGFIDQILAGVQKIEVARRFHRHRQVVAAHRAGELLQGEQGTVEQQRAVGKGLAVGGVALPGVGQIAAAGRQPVPFGVGDLHRNVLQQQEIVAVPGLHPLDGVDQVAHHHFALGDLCGILAAVDLQRLGGVLAAVLGGDLAGLGEVADALFPPGLPHL